MMKFLPRVLMILSLVAAFFVNTAAAGRIYEWVGPDGRKTYSDQPQDNTARVVSGAKPTPKPTPEPDRLTVKRRGKCKDATDRLASYESAGQITMQDASGKTRVLTDAEKVALINDWRDEVSLWCQPAGKGGQ